MSEQNHLNEEKSQNVLHKEIDLIQSVVTRMAQNSFCLKGWCITLVAAIFSLAERDARAWVCLPLAFMVLVFWALDSYYLRQERAYRRLYDHVLKERLCKRSWLDLYSLDAKEMLKHVPCVPRIMFSLSEWTLYLVLFAVLLMFGLGDFVPGYISRIKAPSNTQSICPVPSKDAIADAVVATC